MLSRSKRIDRKNFEQGMKKGYKVFDPFFSMRFLYTSEKDNKFAVVVSKNVTKKAVDRNHLRRQIYEVLKHIDDTVPQKGLLVLVFAQKPVAGFSFDEIKNKIQTLFTATYEKIRR